MDHAGPTRRPTYPCANTKPGRHRSGPILPLWHADAERGVVHLISGDRAASPEGGPQLAIWPLRLSGYECSPRGNPPIGRRRLGISRLASVGSDLAEKRKQSLEPQWLTYGNRLQSIASTGIHCTGDRSDRERYEEIATIANKMLSALGDVPIERIRISFRFLRVDKHRRRYTRSLILQPNRELPWNGYASGTARQSSLFAKQR